jgi:hypothetical protein
MLLVTYEPVWVNLTFLAKFPGGFYPISYHSLVIVTSNVVIIIIIHLVCILVSDWSESTG